MTADTLTILGQVQIHRRDAGTLSCVQDNGICPDWIVHHLDDYLSPLWRHLELTLASVAIGFVIAFALALIAHERRWLAGPIVGVTGILYTIPSLALFAILIPLTGFGFATALIPLTAYTLLILFRNIIAGLDNVPAEAKDAALGMGFTDRQLLWKVELPLALPEIFAGLRVATTTNVGLAALAFYAGAGGLGQQILTDIAFKSNILVAGGLCVLLAFVLDLALLGIQRLMLPWQRARATA
ncbi:Choline transport system permease protein OpuBB [Baekduia alba]|uniref:ABC transporter permease n=1 Tax=Baekduia alba TaxID=2997333 RepID=UPI00233FF414|nr:ABC transporter permease [Baekduia alba]WCB94183.1 Choline transport system permease protein OpuBB [Baekduia alba]